MLYTEFREKETNNTASAKFRRFLPVPKSPEMKATETFRFEISHVRYSSLRLIEIWNETYVANH